jgi:hypothetical protein
MLASLNHPNIAATHGLEESREGVLSGQELAEGLSDIPFGEPKPSYCAILGSLSWQ